MTEAAPVEEAVHRELIARLGRPAIAALLRKPEGPSSGSENRSFVPGCFIGLLGFEDGDRDGASAECCAELLRRGLPLFVRPIEAGGLLVALAACCLGDGVDAASAVGCAAVLPAPRHVGAGEPPSIAEQLFHESPGRYIVCLPADKQTDARLVASQHGVPLWPLGRTGGRELVVRASDAASASSPSPSSSSTGAPGFKEVVRLPVAALRSALEGSL